MPSNRDLLGTCQRDLGDENNEQKASKYKTKIAGVCIIKQYAVLEKELT